MLQGSSVTSPPRQTQMRQKPEDLLRILDTLPFAQHEGWFHQVLAEDVSKFFEFATQFDQQPVVFILMRHKARRRSSYCPKAFRCDFHFQSSKALTVANVLQFSILG